MKVLEAALETLRPAVPLLTMAGVLLRVVAEISLGYDTPRERVEQLLSEGVAKAGLGGECSRTRAA